MHSAEIHAPFFDDLTFDDPAAATAASVPLPGVFLKFSFAVHFFQGMAYAVLQALKPGGDRFFLNHLKNLIINFLAPL